MGTNPPENLPPNCPKAVFTNIVPVVVIISNRPVSKITLKLHVIELKTSPSRNKHIDCIVNQHMSVKQIR